MIKKNREKAKEKDWFLIYHLAKIGSFRGITLTTQEIAEKISSTQQTVSRRLNKLRNLELIEIKTIGKKSTLKITQKDVSNSIINLNSDQTETPELLELRLKAYCDDIQVNEIGFDHEVLLFEGGSQLSYPINVKKDE